MINIFNSIKLNSLKSFLFVLALTLLFNPAKSQDEPVDSPALFNFAIGAGLSTVKIMGDNPGAALMNSTDTSNYHLGGSFDGPQAGLDIRFTFDLDKAGKYRIPLGFIYSPYSAKERVPIAKGLTVFLTHEIIVTNFYTGFQYVFVKFPKARAKGYVGIDIHGSYIYNAQYGWRQVYLYNPENNASMKFDTKPDVWRYGSSLKLGFEGDLYKNVQINVNAGPGIMNLVGKDDSRFELLTPKTDYESQESTVWNFYFSLLLQYRL